MQRKPLGETGISVSVVALGTWALGNDQAWWGLVDDNESIAAIQQALDLGINLIDTAPIYGQGHSEQVVGKAIAGRRDEVIVATKCGLIFPEKPGQTPKRCLSAANIFEECEASLRRLRVDAIDLYQCHWPDPETPIDETMMAMHRLVEQGKIRAIGVSNFGVERLAAAREHADVHCIQPEFSMLHQRANDDLIPYCREHRIGVLAYSPLAKGLLTGKYDTDSKFDDLRERESDFRGRRFEENLATVKRIKRIALKYDRTTAQLAIRWVLNQEGVTSAIVGAKRPSQVRENVAIEDFKLSLEDWREIDSALKGDLGGLG